MYMHVRALHVDLQQVIDLHTYHQEDVGCEVDALLGYQGKNTPVKMGKPCCTATDEKQLAVGRTSLTNDPPMSSAICVT